jgi:hypothetical protein
MGEMDSNRRSRSFRAKAAPDVFRWLTNPLIKVAREFEFTPLPAAGRIYGGQSAPGGWIGSYSVP